MKRDVRVIIAGGGTGGHLFPGIAIAEAFLRRSPGTQVLFIGTNRGLEKRILGQMGYSLAVLDVEGIKGRGFLRAQGALLKLPWSLVQALNILRSFKPQLVIGVGGYASGPAVLMARLLGIPTAVAEQNAIPGITNRILGHVVDRVFLTFPETRSWFAPEKTLVTGNPVRAAFLEGVREEAAPAATAFRLLVFGGSQGAHAINQAMADALPHLQKRRDQIRVVHQTGERDREWMEKAYGAYGMDATVQPFIMDMPGAYGAADLLVCRAGATSIAELTASGKAAILIPFPFAVDDHQTKNAEVLVRAGAAEMIAEQSLDGRVLADAIVRMLEDPGRLREMAERSARLGNARAAADVVDACLGMIVQGR